MPAPADVWVARMAVMRRLTTALAIVVFTMQCLMLVLGLLVLAHAHSITAAADSPLEVKGTCEAGPAALQGGTRTLTISSLEPVPFPVSDIDLSSLHVHASPPFPLESPCVPTGNCHQDQLHCFVHVFLC